MFKVIVRVIIVLVAFLTVLKAFAEDMTMRIVYNNIAYDNELTCGWGMGCVIEGLEKTILFDTGGDGTILLSNMERMGIDPEEIGGKTKLITTGIGTYLLVGIVTWTILYNLYNLPIIITYGFP